MTRKQQANRIRRKAARRIIRRAAHFMGFLLYWAAAFAAMEAAVLGAMAVCVYLT
jgi:hypothetical protein